MEHPTALVIGDALLDVTIEPDEPMRHGRDVPARVRVAAGGQGANVAVRLARRGIRSTLVCALGDDAIGTLLRSELERDGVEVDAVSVDASGAVAVHVGRDGERAMLSQRASFVGRLAGSPTAHRADWVVVSGYVLAEPGGEQISAIAPGVPACRALLGCALSEGARTRWLDAAFALRPDLVLVNEDEARDLTGTSGRADAARGLATQLGAAVVVTGPDGVSAAGSGIDVEVPVPVSGAVRDATGAGDAFAAAVLARLMPRGWPADPLDLEAAIADGIMTARAVIAVPGAQARVPGEHPVEAAP
jgi:sugar/nucleoside kinase (ribokinase family)